jgi:phosphate transport system substrate-binding protein
VANTPEAIGYISSGLIDERVNTLALDSIPPTFENVASCRYRIVRPFLLLTSQPPAGPVKQFIDYCMSLDGQDILRQSGLIPAMDISR